MTNTIQKNIQRDLIKRLLIAGAAISIVIVAIAYYLERNRIISDITFYATQRSAQINPLLYDLLDDPKQINSDVLEQRLVRKEGPTKQKNGYFPVVNFYDLDGDLVYAYTDTQHPDHQALSRELKTTPKTPLQDKAVTAEPIRVSDRPVIRLGLPLYDRNGEHVLHVVAIYALSDSVLADFNKRLQRSLLLTLLVVATTALVIYPVVLGLIKRVQRLSLSLLDANLETAQTLGAAIAKRDSDTDAHNYRVTLYSVRLGERTGIDEPTMQGLIKGAFLHDVGKIGTEDKILLKPGKLDDDEFSIMRKHVDHGLDIVNRSAWLADAVPIVGCHHEKYDGSGYPNTLKGEQIPIGARIFAIADVFDALTSVRPYKEAFSLERSMEILQEGRGSHFDPMLLDRFAEIAPELYRTFAGDESREVRKEVAKIVQTYFPHEEST